MIAAYTRGDVPDYQMAAFAMSPSTPTRWRRPRSNSARDAPGPATASTLAPAFLVCDLDFSADAYLLGDSDQYAFARGTGGIRRTGWRPTWRAACCAAFNGRGYVNVHAEPVIVIDADGDFDKVGTGYYGGATTFDTDGFNILSVRFFGLSIYVR